MYVEAVKETLNKLNFLIGVYVDSPEHLAALMPVYEEVSTVAELYERLKKHGAGERFLKRSLDFAISSDAPSSSSSTTTTTTTGSPPITTTTTTPPAFPPPAAAAAATASVPLPLLSAVPREPVPESVSCPICFDTVKGADCIRLACGHCYCLDCLDDMLGVRVKEGRVLDIKCPTPTCMETLTYADIHQIITDEAVLAKYEEFLFLSALRAEPNLRWCPKPGCGNAVIG
jgi:hypothetical protein